MQAFLQKVFPPLQGPALWGAIAAIAIFWIAMFFIMRAMSPAARKALIATVTFVAGLFYVIEFFYPATLKDGQENFLTFAVPTVGNLINVLVAFTLGLGVFSLVRVHGTNILKQKSGWENSVVLIAALVLMAVAGLAFENTLFYRSLFRDVLNSFDSAMFAILAFFIVSAAYRAFRIRSAEATLLMAAALVVMLGQIPIGQFITSGLPEKGSFVSLFRLDSISNWVLMYVNTPALRAVNFGLGVGLFGIALRLWLSLERGAYFEAKAED